MIMLLMLYVPTILIDQSKERDCLHYTSSLRMKTSTSSWMSRKCLELLIVYKMEDCKLEETFREIFVK